MIEIINVHKSFGKQHVLRGITLTIQDGKTTAIVGPSGTGKSVLLKLIVGLLEPDAGDIKVSGQSVTSSSPDERMEITATMGVLFQGAALMDSLNVYDNVAFPLRARGMRDEKKIAEQVELRLTEVGLEDYSLAVPGEISIGMRKRVGVARALVTSPKILLFDEPNTGLDPQAGQELYDLIRETQRKLGFTGIVISHEIPEVFQVCDRVAMLYEGQVQAEGPVESFVASPNPVVQQFIRGEVTGPIQMS